MSPCHHVTHCHLLSVIGDNGVISVISDVDDIKNIFVWGYNS